MQHNIKGARMPAQHGGGAAPVWQRLVSEDGLGGEVELPRQAQLRIAHPVEDGCLRGQGALLAQPHKDAVQSPRLIRIRRVARKVASCVLYKVPCSMQA